MFPFFSRILEGRLPGLKRLTVAILCSLDDDLLSVIPLRKPIALKLPMDIPLTLDLYNVALHWLSAYFTGLRELHLDFNIWCIKVALTENELLEILGASFPLECLSLRSGTTNSFPRSRRATSEPHLPFSCEHPGDREIHSGPPGSSCYPFLRHLRLG